MLADYMTKQDFTVSSIHADHTHEERKRVVKVHNAIMIFIDNFNTTLIDLNIISIPFNFRSFVMVVQEY